MLRACVDNPFAAHAARNGGGGASLLGERGGDISTVLGVGFSEAVTGSTASVTMGALGACPDCKGSGSDASFRAADCRVCKGSGEILVKRWSPGGNNNSSSSSQGAVPVLAVPQACPACRGSGKSESQDCSRCAGEGRVQLRRKVRFKVGNTGRWGRGGLWVTHVAPP